MSDDKKSELYQIVEEICNLSKLIAILEIDVNYDNLDDNELYVNVNNDDVDVVIDYSQYYNDQDNKQLKIKKLKILYKKHSKSFNKLDSFLEKYVIKTFFRSKNYIFELLLSYLSVKTMYNNQDSNNQDSNNQDSNNNFKNFIINIKNLFDKFKTNKLFVLNDLELELNKLELELNELRSLYENNYEIFNYINKLSINLNLFKNLKIFINELNTEYQEYDFDDFAYKYYRIRHNYYNLIATMRDEICPETIEE